MVLQKYKNILFSSRCVLVTSVVVQFCLSIQRKIFFNGKFNKNRTTNIIQFQRNARLSPLRKFLDPLQVDLMISSGKINTYISIYNSIVLKRSYLDQYGIPARDRRAETKRKQRARKHIIINSENKVLQTIVDKEKSCLLRGCAGIERD